MHFCHTIVHQPAYTETSNAWPEAMHLLPYDCASASVFTDNKRMAKSHASTAIRLCISPQIHRHQTHGLKPCMYYHTIVHQPANTQTPNAWPKAMHLLPYDFSSARVYTDTKRMAKSHASTAIRLCISPQIHRHQTHGLKPCMYYHTIVHQPAYTQTLTHGLKPCNYCHTACCASASVYTKSHADIKRMA